MAVLSKIKSFIPATFQRRAAGSDDIEMLHRSAPQTVLSANGSKMAVRPASGSSVAGYMTSASAFPSGTQAPDGPERRGYQAAVSESGNDRTNGATGFFKQESLSSDNWEVLTDGEIDDAKRTEKTVRQKQDKYLTGQAKKKEIVTALTEYAPVRFNVGSALNPCWQDSEIINELEELVRALRCGQNDPESKEKKSAVIQPLLRNLSHKKSGIDIKTAIKGAAASLREIQPRPVRRCGYQDIEDNSAQLVAKVKDTRAWSEIISRIATGDWTRLSFLLNDNKLFQETFLLIVFSTSRYNDLGRLNISRCDFSQFGSVFGYFTDNTNIEMFNVLEKYIESDTKRRFAAENVRMMQNVLLKASKITSFGSTHLKMIIDKFDLELNAPLLDEAIKRANGVKNQAAADYLTRCKEKLIKPKKTG